MKNSLMILIFVFFISSCGAKQEIEIPPILSSSDYQTDWHIRGKKELGVIQVFTLHNKTHIQFLLPLSDCFRPVVRDKSGFELFGRAFGHYYILSGQAPDQFFIHVEDSTSQVCRRSCIENELREDLRLRNL